MWALGTMIIEDVLLNNKTKEALGETLSIKNSNQGLQTTDKVINETKEME